MQKVLLSLLLLNAFARCHPGDTGHVINNKTLVKFWDLKTGSHIAYVHLPADDSANATPLIFLHGGPGACQVNSFGKEAPVEWYEKLTRNNFDVYIYDQSGSGLSGRLSDPTQYTVDRHVSDLEEIRIIIGNKSCILIGDSWGATLATHYMAKYPQHVLKAIFTSPGSIDLRDWNDEYSNVPRFLSGWYDWIGNQYGQERLNRYYKLDELMQTDVHKAYIFAGDKEMDQLADDFISAEILKTCVYHKSFTKSSEFKMKGMGWWASAMTIFDLMNIEPVKYILKQNTTPVLILRGDADYLSPGIANQYTTIFSNSRLVRVPRAGHFIWLDQPRTYRQEIENFLTE
ncbi:MAG TPA: alpha/beta hydrolase [Bacteroidales bacterium]|nr:alpha/beta hydrolase [Bacteroidales bacterium]